VPELSVCLSEARSQITQADQVYGQRKTLEQQIREGQRSLPRLQEAVQSAQDDEDAWMNSWLVAVQSAGYAADVPVDQVEAKMTVMQDLERLLESIRSIRSERIETMQVDLDGLAASASSLAVRGAPDLAAQSPEDIALELARRLEVAQRVDVAFADLQARLQRNQADLARAQHGRQAVLARLTPWMTATGTVRTRQRLMRWMAPIGQPAPRHSGKRRSPP
jgi:hypothetical protein